MNEDRRQSREPQPTHADYARADALRVRPCSHGYRSSGSCRECKAEAFAACRAEYEAKLADERKHADELAKALDDIRCSCTRVTISGVWTTLKCTRCHALAAHAARRAARDGDQEGTR